MAGNSSTGIVSDAEIEAALRQAEAAAESIPSLDDGSGEKIVPIPVQALPQVPPRRSAAPSAEPATPAVAAIPAAPAAPAPAVAPPAPVAAVAEPAVALPATAEAAPVAQRASPVAYRVLDTVLWALNRPFEWLSPEMRNLIGLLALATIVVSLLAVFLLPWLFPRVDLLTQLRH